ncbi:unnamed protein product [Rotaria sp. Silwood2]|nr:unnamed protein product [Rotaria sp. Silwood2]CAF4463219.1 unnamed protein product [Rotaria sp. Silwood2]
MNIVKQVDLPNFRFDVNNINSQALIKPVDQTISIGDQSGSNDESGSSGYCDMFSGTDGKGGNGTDRLDGKPSHSS